MSILDQPILSRIRRNHGLEHATLTILANQKPQFPLSGISFPGGFFVFGKVETSDLRQAIFTALNRMNNGENNLAIHPNCGTNFVVSGLISGLAAWLGMARAEDRKERFARLPLVISLVTLAFIISRPLGPLVQKHVTTSGEPGDLQIVAITPLHLGGFPVHRVVTRSS